MAVPRHLREKVDQIQAELRQTARIASRPSAAEYAPHIAYLVEMGYSDILINEAFGWDKSRRWLRKIKQEGRLDGTGRVKVEPDAVPLDRLPEEYQAMLEWKPEAFIAFYDRFNFQPMPEHCREWVYEAFESDLLLLNVPPRHNKSTLFSVWWPLWNIVRDRDTQTLIISETNTLSGRWIGYIAAYLAYGEIPEVFGRFKPEVKGGELPWRPSSGELMVLGRKRGNQGGMQFSFLSRSQGAQILGFEADIIVLDDITNRKIAASPTQRQEQIDWLHSDVLTRLQPDGRVLVVGQRVHMNDIYGYMKELTWDIGPKKDEPLFTCISHPAILQWAEEEDYSDGIVLWPDVWPYDRLMKSYQLVGGKAGFFTMYQQDPVSADATLVKEAWLEACRDYDRTVGVGVKRGEGEQFLPVVRVASLDPSPTMYNGLVVADVVVSRESFFAVIVDVQSFKADWRSIRENLLTTIDRYKPQYFIFEKNIAQYWAKGDPFIEEIRSRCKVLAHTTSGQNKFDLETGLESLGYDFETANIRLPYGSPESKSTSNLLEREARGWTREGRLRDDVLMALWFIKFNYKKLYPTDQLQDHFQGTIPVEPEWRRKLRSGIDPAENFRRKYGTKFTRERLKDARETYRYQVGRGSSNRRLHS